MFVTNVDATPIGILFGGEIKQKVGVNYVDYMFDTNFFVPGKYYVDILLYDEDNAGGVMYYDKCTSFLFNIEHSSESIHLKNWFRDWGNAVLPCIEKMGDENNV